MPDGAGGRRYPKWMARLGLVRRGEQVTVDIRRRDRVRWWAAGCYVVVVLAVVATLVPPVRRSIACLVGGGPCPTGLTRVTVNGRTEYVGVTDGYPFRPDLVHAMKVLRRQNATATADGPGTYVTVAVAGPLATDEPRTLHRVEGAIAGQYAANHGGVVGGRPRIRLVLANMDGKERHWSPVSHRLREMVSGDAHLRAVAGMGLSQAETVDAMTVLRGAHVPTVSDMTTADTINETTQRGFARVAPDTGQQLDVLGDYLRPRLAHHKAMLVAYSNPTDLYTSALKSDFQQDLGGPWRAGGEVVTPFGDKPDNEFPQIVSVLCGTRGIDTVYYAGRAADLPLFLTYLGNRLGCRPGKIRVITTSDTSRLLVPTAANRRAWAALRNKDRPIELIYTPLADPRFLASRPDNRIGQLRDRFGELGFRGADLDTGWAITEYDAVLTAAQAIRKAAGANGDIPPAQNVAEQLRLMNAPTTAVPGASGGIRLDPETGDRYDLRIPVLRFVPGKPSEVLTKGGLGPSDP